MWTRVQAPQGPAAWVALGREGAEEECGRQGFVSATRTHNTGMHLGSTLAPPVCQAIYFSYLSLSFLTLKQV